MRKLQRVFAIVILLTGSSLLNGGEASRFKAEANAKEKTPPVVSQEKFQTRNVAGWTVHVNHDLLTKEPENTAHALELLEIQLNEIMRVVPAVAVTELQKVTLWFSPEYPKIIPRAEFHPSADWLVENGRDPAMANGVEFTNVRIFDRETRRMPNFALHELAHAYHHRNLPGGFSNAEIQAAYDRAKISGKYDLVERKDADGNRRMDRAYALTNPQEYFAETTEAFFVTNDFFPYTRPELKQIDPEMVQLLTRLWGVVNESRDLK